MLTWDSCKMLNTNVPMICKSYVPYFRSSSLNQGKTNSIPNSMFYYFGTFSALSSHWRKFVQDILDDLTEIRDVYIHITKLMSFTKYIVHQKEYFIKTGIFHVLIVIKNFFTGSSLWYFFRLVSLYYNIQLMKTWGIEFVMEHENHIY